VASVDIARGENARRAISYGNVVQEIRELKWTDINFGIAEFRAEIDRDNQTGLVLLQENKFGPILASAEIVDDDCADLDRLHQSASLEAANVADVAMGVAAWADLFVSGEWFAATALNAAVLDSHGEHQVFKEIFEMDVDAAVASIGERP
ncbi:MAG: hypothetical protein OXN84_04330, partial [Albidovulum sp.]|nr:hypothetical protein [Albidovulum sp.]